MKYFNMTITTFLFGTFVFLKLVESGDSMPMSKFCKHDFKNPSHVRKIHLYSKQGHYMAILENGTVVAKLDRDSPDTILEMYSYSVNIKRIKRPNSNHWLAIDKNGHIRTRRKQRKDTLFYEDHDEGWLWYQNCHDFVLAFRKNYMPKDKVTKHDTLGKKTKFLIMAPKLKNRKRRSKSVGLQFLKSKLYRSMS